MTRRTRPLTFYTGKGDVTRDVAVDPDGRLVCPHCGRAWAQARALFLVTPPGGSSTQVGCISDDCLAGARTVWMNRQREVTH